MIRLVAIIGPTAAGKSRLALRLARRFNGEIVSADSRQVYRYMDIGTAKPDKKELQLVPHHLIDIINPDDDFSLATYQQLAFQAIENIHKRGRLPLLAGGSGLYFWAVVEGWRIPRVAPDPVFRQRLEDRAAGGEADLLYRELMETDPVAAQSIDRHNVRRLIRALEVSGRGPEKFSRLQSKTPPPFETLIIGLTTDRKELYKRTDLRVDEMIKRGLVDEVRGLADRGYDPGLPAMSGIGYRQAGLFLKGELGLEEAVRQIKTETHRLVRRQYNWFKLDDDRIRWFDITDSNVEKKITGLVADFLSG